MTQKENEEVTWITHEFSPLLDLVEAIEYLKNIDKSNRKI